MTAVEEVTGHSSFGAFVDGGMTAKQCEYLYGEDTTPSTKKHSTTFVSPVDVVDSSFDTFWDVGGPNGINPFDDTQLSSY